MNRFVGILLVGTLLLPAPAFAFTPGNYDIIMQAGEDYTASYFEKDNAGLLINQTGMIYAAQFRSAPMPGGVLFANYSAFVSDTVAQTIVWKLSKAQTLAQSGKAGVWDLRRTDAVGLVTYRLSGKVACKPTVTRLP